MDEFTLVIFFIDGFTNTIGAAQIATLYNRSVKLRTHEVVRKIVLKDCHGAVLNAWLKDPDGDCDPQGRPIWYEY